MKFSDWKGTVTSLTKIGHLKLLQNEMFHSRDSYLKLIKLLDLGCCYSLANFDSITEAQFLTLFFNFNPYLKYGISMFEMPT